MQLKQKPMIGSLVRLHDNFLHYSESEQMLRQENYFEELIDFYKSKRDHKKGDKGKCFDEWTYKQLCILCKLKLMRSTYQN